MASSDMNAGQRSRLNAFAENLYRLRSALGLSQSELARKLWGTVVDGRGYTVAKNRDQISNYERGKYIPGRETLVMLAKALNVAPDKLDAGFSGDPTQGPPEITMTMKGGDVILTMNMSMSLSFAVEIIATAERAKAEMAARIPSESL